jgi:hypothetical protein
VLKVICIALYGLAVKHLSNISQFHQFVHLQIDISSSTALKISNILILSGVLASITQPFLHFIVFKIFDFSSIAMILLKSDSDISWSLEISLILTSSHFSAT